MLTGISLRKGVNTETLADNKTLTVDQMHKYGTQVLDPGGSNRNLVLPAEAQANGLSQLVKNSADASEVITIQNDAAGTVCQILPNQFALVLCVDGAWQAIVGLPVVRQSGAAQADQGAMTTVGSNTGTAGAGLSLIGNTTTVDQAANLMNDLVAIQEDIASLDTLVTEIRTVLIDAGLMTGAA